MKENIESGFHDVGFTNGFLDMTQKTEETKGEIDTLDFIKIKNFVWKRMPSLKCNYNPQNGRKYSQIMSDKGFVARTITIKFSFYNILSFCKDNQNVIYTYNGIFSNHNKEQSTKTYHSIKEFGINSAK